MLLEHCVHVLACTVLLQYVPFGAYIQEFLLQVGLDSAVPGHGWRDGVIHIDEAFVTPLVVTQVCSPHRHAAATPARAFRDA